VDKIDLSKDLKPLWSPPRGKFVAVDVPQLNFLMIDGTGDPNTAQSYKDALNTLYSVTYTAKFMLKLGPRKIDFRVMPLEGLWWSGDMDDFRKARKDRWKWTAMIALPDAVTKADIKAAMAKATEKKELPALKLLRLEAFREGKVMQTLYFGPYADEGPTIAALHKAIADAGHTLRGKHHEIYMSDPRRTAPAKLKTIIRQPYG
jgi:hypothetical protein